MKRLAWVALMLGMTSPLSTSAQQPFSIEVDGQQIATFSNFRLGRSIDQGVPIQELQFDVRVNQPCPAILIYRTVVSKTGVILKAGTWDQRLHRPAAGSVHLGRIGDITIEWPQVGAVRVWPVCSPA